MFKSIAVPNPLTYDPLLVYNESFELFGEIEQDFGACCDITMGNVDNDIALEIIATRASVNTVTRISLRLG